MRAKEIISKKIVSPIRLAGKSIPKLFLAGFVSLLGSISLTSIPTRGIIVYAQQQQQQSQALDLWSEAAKIAHAKVEAATTPGAFGHGVPDLHNFTTQDMLIVFGVVAIGSILAYTITKYLRNRPVRMPKLAC